MNPAEPASFPRRILVAVSGLSPQVVTETLYALAVSDLPRFVPTEIHLVTTSEGADRARLTLLSGGPGWLQRLCDEYSIPRPALDDAHIHVIADSTGQPLEDLRTPAENEFAADTILGAIRRFTSDPAAAVHVSIAGGRKTMGFFAGYALSLLGREQDRLSHVLVAPPYEGHPEFFYPTRSTRIIYTGPGSRPVDTSKAVVQLAAIPFIPLQHFLAGVGLSSSLTFRGAVAAARSVLDTPELTLRLDDSVAAAGGVKIPLPPAEMAFLLWFALRRLRGQPGVACPSEGAPDPDFAHHFLQAYRHIFGASGLYGRTARTLRQGMEKAFFLERKSRLNQALRRALGLAAGPYLIRPHGKRPATFFQLDLEPSKIRISPMTETNTPL